MCGKRLKRVAIITFLLSVLPFSQPCLFISYGEETMGYVTLTVQEWNDFKTDWTEQMTELAMLKQNLSVLTLNSTEQQEQAEEITQESATA